MSVRRTLIALCSAVVSAFMVSTAHAQDRVDYTYRNTSGSIITTSATPPTPGSDYRGTLNTSFVRPGSLSTGGQIIIEPVIDPIVRLGINVTNLSDGPSTFFHLVLPEAKDLYFLDDSFASSFNFSRIIFSDPVANAQANEKGYRSIRFELDPSQGDVPLAADQTGYFQFRMRAPEDGRFVMEVNPAPIPEPGTLLLVTAGVLPFLGRVRTARRRSFSSR